MINQERLIKTFMELVQIDSPSGEETAMAQHVSGVLEKLGAKVDVDEYGNVIGKFEGVGEAIMINSHLDTVEPGRGIKPKIDGEKIVSDGTTILGGDAKAGVAAILEALTSLRESGAKHVPIEVVFTLSEEIGLLGAVHLDYSKITAKHGVTFDGEKSVNYITTSAPGYTRVDVTVIGRSAHAGLEPEKGISAIKIAAEIISMLQIGRIDHETTANIGLIEGGSAVNAVPERVLFKAEIRSRDIQKLEKHTEHFQSVFEEIRKKYPEAKIEVVSHREFDPYVFEKNHPVIQQTTAVLKDMGLTPILEPSGGGTDVNIFHTHGIQAICVGIADYSAHTKREYILIPELLDTAKFCEKLLSSI
jgi:tripeptide aminopeptidase